MSENFPKSTVWNINGLNSDKISDPFFIQSISKFHIVSFKETWSNDADEINLLDFCRIGVGNRKKCKKATRNSGGIGIYVKNLIAKGIKILQKSHPDILWVKLDHTFFNLNRHIYLATIYISPENSNVYDFGIETIYDRPSK